MNYIKEMQVVLFLDSPMESFVIEILLSFLYIWMALTNVCKLAP